MEEHSWSWKVSLIAVRILGLYLLIHAIITGGQDAFVLSTTAGQVRWWTLVALIGMGLIGAALLIWSEAIADRLSLGTGDGAEAPSSALDARTLLWISLGVIGVVIAVDGLVAVLTTTGQLISLPVGFGPQVNPAYWYLGAAILRTLIGLWLVAKARRVIA